MTTPLFSQASVCTLLTRITAALGASTEEHAKFERWADASLRQVLAAARGGPGALRWQAGVLRQQLAELQHDIHQGIAVTGRTELQRLCRREWLESVLGWLDDAQGSDGAAERLAA